MSSLEPASVLDAYVREVLPYTPGTSFFGGLLDQLNTLADEVEMLRTRMGFMERQHAEMMRTLRRELFSAPEEYLLALAERDRLAAVRERRAALRVVAGKEASPGTKPHDEAS